MRQWRAIYDSPLTGAANMAADEAIMLAVARGDSPPTLRLYAWQPPTLSLGFGQRAADVDLARLGELGWGIVRRPTGGRAILHTDELTYSVALPENHPLAAGGIVETYLRLSQALLAALDGLGVSVIAAPEAAATQAGPVCFEVPSRYEITLDGRKLIGSAQMRRQGGVLQHGTLPLTGDIARICDALVYTSDAERSQAKLQVRQRAATLADAGIAVTWAQAAAAVVNGFSQALSISFEAAPMTPQEQAHAEHLHQTVYSTAEWTNKR